MEDMNTKSQEGRIMNSRCLITKYKTIALKVLDAKNIIMFEQEKLSKEGNKLKTALVRPAG